MGVFPDSSMTKIGRPVDGTLPAFKSVCASSASRSAFLRALRGYEVVSSVFMVGYGAALPSGMPASGRLLTIRTTRDIGQFICSNFRREEHSEHFKLRFVQAPFARGHHDVRTICSV